MLRGSDIMSVVNSMRQTLYSIKCMLCSLVPVRSTDDTLSPCPICGRKPYILEDSGPWGTWYAVYCPTSWLLFKIFGADKHSHLYVHCGKANSFHAYNSAAKEWNNQTGCMIQSSKVRVEMTQEKQLHEQLLH